MNITEFKTLLRNGEVKFEFKKLNGETRYAYGTLCESLTPKTTAIRKFKLSNIDWVKSEFYPDSDKLPKSMTIKISEEFILDHGIGTPMHNIIENALLKQLNYLADDFDFEEVKPKKLAENKIFYYDLDKNGYRSFNFDTQFIGLV